MESVELLKSYGWDSDVNLVTVRKEDVLTVLREFLAGTLASDEVQSWANRIEGRDDIDFELGPEGAVNEAVFWLANPFLNFQIDSSLCARIERMFSGA